MAQLNRQPIFLQAFGANIALNTVDGDGRLHDRVYEALSGDLIEGQMAPLRPVSLRSLALGLGVSPMPVREAARRLIAERALEPHPLNQRLRVPAMSLDRLSQLKAARIWVEGELAAAACARIDTKTRQALIHHLRKDDAEVGAAFQAGDVETYMRANHDFHFSLYRASGCDLWLEMARVLWLQTGPFMRVVFDRLSAVDWPKDYHGDLIDALSEGHVDRVKTALVLDVADGMDLMRDGLNAEPALPKTHKPSRKP